MTLFYSGNLPIRIILETYFTSVAPLSMFWFYCSQIFVSSPCLAEFKLCFSEWDELTLNRGCFVKSGLRTLTRLKTLDSSYGILVG